MKNTVAPSPGEAIDPAAGLSSSFTRPPLSGPRQKRTLWAWAAATFLGAGLLRPGPGTWGSAAACLLWWAAGAGLNGAESKLTLVTAAAAAAALAVGIPAGTRVERESGKKDPGHVVIDEAAGQWTALLFAPADPAYMLAAFLLFRGFDILKPWPARRLEHLPGGWGIMLDDLAAGFYALLVVQLLGSWIGR